MSISLYNRLSLLARDLPAVRFRGALRSLLTDHPLYSLREFCMLESIVQLTHIERNNKFFEILLRIMNQNVFDEFLLILEENYWWVAKKLQYQADLNGNRPTEYNLPSDTYDRQETLKEKAESVLRRGGAPLHQLSSLCVSRSKMMERLKNEIIGLKPGMFLVLHGMSGSGKSSLAMEVLKDYELVFNHLQGNVFWISELKNIEHIHKKLLNLISDGDQFVGEMDPINCEAKIAHIIKKKNLQNAMIVFDDVVSNVKYLNFSCKKLIITHDEHIVNREPTKEVKQIKIDLRLTDKEAKILLSQATGFNLSELPEEANEIIRLTQGFPFLLHFLARHFQQNKESLNNELWKKTTEILRRERRGKEDGPMNYILDNLYNVFDHHLGELSTEMQRYYEMCAVFQSDINLMTEVFTTIWSMNEMKAMVVLDEFYNKSLIGKKPNAHIGGQLVFGIHDVCLYYLRNRKKDDMKELHNELIDKYNTKCGGELWKLPVDNYIHFYLGYHLENAERLDLFSLFVNLQFVSAKIKAVGTTDLLNDYEKYEKYIATKDNENLFEELKTFVRHYGHILHQSDDVDIIQLGLQQEESSAIFESARALAQKQPDKIFLNFQPKHKHMECNSDSLSFKIKGHVNVACFSDHLDYAFLGQSDGNINKKRLDRLHSAGLSFETGHKKSVIHLVLSPNQRYLMSVDQDLEFRAWDLIKINDKRFNLNGTLKNGNQSPSPPARQKDYSPIFNSGLKLADDFIVKETHRRPLTCLRFSPNSEYIFSCSDDKCVKMWCFEKDIGGVDVLRSMWEDKTASVARCCAFSTDGSTVLVGCDNKTLISMSVDGLFARKKKNYNFDSAVKCLHTIVGVNGTHPPIEGHSNFVLVLGNKVEVIRIKNSYLQASGAEVSTNKNYDVLCSWTYQKSQENFVTRSWVGENGAFIALTTSRHCVSLYNLANGHLQREYIYESSQVIMSIDLLMKENTSYMLVLCENGNLHREKLELAANEQASKLCVAPNWSGHLQQPTLVLPCINGFKVIGAQSITTEFDLKTNVTSCHIDSNGSVVVIGTDCGTVQLFDLSTGHSSTSLHFKDGNRNPSLVVLVKVFVVESENLIVGVDSKHLVKIFYRSDEIEYQARSKVKGVWYSSDTNELILVELNQQIKMWKVINKVEIVDNWTQTNGNDNDLLEGLALVRCCDLSSSNYLAVATSKMVKLCNLINKEKNDLSFDQTLNCCGFSADGKCLAFGFADGAIKIYNVDLQAIGETNVKRSVHRVCVGNGARVFGALSAKRIYLGRLPSASADFRIGCTELVAKQLFKAANHDCFLAIDTRSQIYQVKFYNSFDLSGALSTLTISKLIHDLLGSLDLNCPLNESSSD
ncbi:apoptotic protease-activating factor 1 [Nilaparvata lugens]|uniref:apoptotic protease-activating factor 1 n=1 Tax=Nilaparvata lugens TaxID=108931 RepID=UPI00193EBAD8|nr:apoptotic protease-activating factor 1 [Nilaparvata lugens]